MAAIPISFFCSRFQSCAHLKPLYTAPQKYRVIILQQKIPPEVSCMTPPKGEIVCSSQKNLRVRRYREIPTCKADKIPNSKQSIFFTFPSTKVPPLCSFPSHPCFFLTIAVRSWAAYLERGLSMLPLHFSLTNSSPYGFSNTGCKGGLYIILLFYFLKKGKSTVWVKLSRKQYFAHHVLPTPFPC